ncbi:hypothetical protein Tco_0718781 [Tanacetum coccineum]
MDFNQLSSISSFSYLPYMQLAEDLEQFAHQAGRMSMNINDVPCLLALPYEVPTLGVVAYGVVAWTRKKKGANRDQHSRDQRARSGGLWSGGLDPKRGANRDQHSRDQRGCWFFKGWGIVMIPHRPSMGLVDGL